MPKNANSSSASEANVSMSMVAAAAAVAANVSTTEGGSKRKTPRSSKSPSAALPGPSGSSSSRPKKRPSHTASKPPGTPHSQRSNISGISLAQTQGSRHLNKSRQEGYDSADDFEEEMPTTSSKSPPKGQKAVASRLERGTGNSRETASLDSGYRSNVRNATEKSQAKPRKNVPAAPRAKSQPSKKRKRLSQQPPRNPFADATRVPSSLGGPRPGSSKSQPSQSRRKEVKALWEIRRYQRSVDLLIPRAPFVRLIKEIMPDGYRIQSSAVDALREIAEAKTVRDFEGAYIVRAKITLLSRFINLIQFSSIFSLSAHDPREASHADAKGPHGLSAPGGAHHRLKARNYNLVIPMQHSGSSLLLELFSLFGSVKYEFLQPLCHHATKYLYTA